MISEIPNHKVSTLDYDVFYEAWYPKVRTAAYQIGLTGQDVEDAIHDIFTDLMEGQYLERYAPERAEFSTYIWSQVRGRLKTCRKRQNKRNSVEFCSVEFTGLYDRDEEYTNLRDDLGSVELVIMLNEVYKDLRQLRSTETKDLARLFNDLLTQVEQEGKTSTRKLQVGYGIKHQAITEQIKDLRNLPVIKALKRALQP